MLGNVQCSTLERVLKPQYYLSVVEIVEIKVRDWNRGIGLISIGRRAMLIYQNNNTDNENNTCSACL